MYNLTHELEEKYNQIVIATMANCVGAGSRNKNKIVFNKFNYKNSNHLYLLKVGMIVGPLYGMKIAINCNFFHWLRLRKKYKNAKIRWSICRRAGGLNSDELLKFMAQEFQEPLFIFTKIYNVFYNEEIKDD